MTNPIYILSKGRPEKCPTTELFPHATLVLEKEDVPKYEAAGVKNKIEVLPESNGGITVVRNWIIERAQSLGQKHIWMADDDINFLGHAGPPIKKDDPIAILEDAERAFNYRSRVAQIGFEYVQIWYNHNQVQINKAIQVISGFDTELFGKSRYVKGLDLKEDQDITLQLLSKGCNTVRLGHYAQSCPSIGMNKGGLHDTYQNREWLLDVCKKMERRWLGTCKAFMSKKQGGMPEVKIKWREFGSKSISVEEYEKALESNANQEVPT